MGDQEPAPFVTIKCEIQDDEMKEEEEEDEKEERIGFEPLDSGKRTQIVIATPSVANNNSPEVMVKEEPLERAEEEEVDGGLSFEIEAEKTITFKTEPRDISPDPEAADVDIEAEDEKSAANADDDDDEEEEEEELDFYDDDADEDFELYSSEGADTPDSAGGSHDTSEGDLGSDDEQPSTSSADRRGHIDVEEVDVDIEGGVEEDEAMRKKRKIVKPMRYKEGKGQSMEDDEEDEEDDKKRGSFEINGMTVETIGNYSVCPKCKKKIKSTFIIRHIKLHDVPEEHYNCPAKNCALTVNRVNNLIRHLRVVHKSNTPYMCKMCFRCFSKPSVLRQHFEQHKEEKRNKRKAAAAEDEELRQYPCEFPGCGKEYKKRHHLKEHERKHTGDMKYRCDVCGKRFYIHAHMKRHLYSHTGIKPHVCRWKCGAIFASYGGRMKHERINHYDENPLQSECDICERPFKNQQQLAKHRMTHLNPKERMDYRCSYCGIMLDTIKLRERHEERHKDGEVFACETCNRTFKNEKNLSHHIKTHHTPKDEKDVNVNKASRPKKEPPPKHHCHVCGPPKLFCLTSLRRHLARIHSTNFKCPREECGKCFKEKAQLDSHVEIHRLRECHLCGKKFQRKQNADIHLLGVHGMSKDDLVELGRWNPKKEDGAACPNYMTRKSNWKKKEAKARTMTTTHAPKVKTKTKKTANGETSVTTIDTGATGIMTVDFEAVDDIKLEPADEGSVDDPAMMM